MGMSPWCRGWNLRSPQITVRVIGFEAVNRSRWCSWHSVRNWNTHRVKYASARLLFFPTNLNCPVEICYLYGPAQYPPYCSICHMVNEERMQKAGLNYVVNMYNISIESLVLHYISKRAPYLSSGTRTFCLISRKYCCSNLLLFVPLNVWTGGYV